MEIYKDIKGYEGLYQVSNKGNVKSLPKHRRSGNGYSIRPEKVMKQSVNRTGYNRVGLIKNGKVKQHFVARLVAIHFVDNPDNKPEVNHIDEDKTNNDCSNLEWVTREENMRHNGLMDRLVGKFKLSRSKPLYQYLQDGRFVKKWTSGAEAQLAGFTGTAISACVHGHQKTHKGYVWSLEPLHGDEYTFNVDGENIKVVASDLITAVNKILKEKKTFVTMSFLSEKEGLNC